MTHLLGLKDVPYEDIKQILDTAFEMKEILGRGEIKKKDNLNGKSIITLFFENSTRTRLSFELASKYLGAVAANIAASGSSVAKGETLIDTAKTIDSMAADVIIMRHSSSGAAKLIADNVNAAVVNAGDGMNEHPTQALLDMMTIRENKGHIDGLKVAIIGDIKHSRVARSNIYGLHTMGAEVVLGGPSTLMPSNIEGLGVKAYYNVEDAIKDADVVMGLRIQLERQKSGMFPTIREYSKFFGIDEKRLKLAKPDAIVLHPGPVNRGVELSVPVIDGKQSLINEQVTNGVAVRMAVLDILANNGGKKN